MVWSNGCQLLWDIALIFVSLQHCQVLATVQYGSYFLFTCVAFDHTGKWKYASKDMMDLCLSRPLIIGQGNHIKNNCFTMWLPERLMSCDLRNAYNSITWNWGFCYYELDFLLLKWFFCFVFFLHSKTNMQYNIVIKISVSNAPGVLLAVICTTTVVE